MSKRKRFTFRLPDELYEKLKKEASEQGFSLNAFMIHILRNWLKSKEL